MTRITLNLETLTLEGFPEFSLTAEQWKDLVFPPCPKCGDTIDVDRIDVTMLSDICGAWDLRKYVPGRWRCWNDCDPRTIRSEDAKS